MIGRALIRLLLTTAIVLGLPASSFAQVKVLLSGGFSAAFQELLPEFEKTTGIKVSVARGPSQGSGPNTIRAQLGRGVHADVVIMSRQGLDELIAERRIVAGTDIDLAQTPLGMAVHTGAPKPDISTVDAFRETLLRAKSIAVISTPGVYMTTELFPRLGIAKEISGKITFDGVAAVAGGKSEIVIQPVSELLNVPEVDYVGTIPVEIQFVSVFSAATVNGANEPEACKRLIAFLASENAREALRKTGMEPARSR